MGRADLPGYTTGILIRPALSGTDLNGNSVLWGTNTLEGNSVLVGHEYRKHLKGGTSALWGVNATSPGDQAGLSANVP